MKKRYELIKTELGENLIMFDENGIASGVPFDLGNSDYQAYLKRDEAETIQSCLTIKGTGR